MLYRGYHYIHSLPLFFVSSFSSSSTILNLTIHVMSNCVCEEIIILHLSEMGLTFIAVYNLQYRGIRRKKKKNVPRDEDFQKEY